jgi:chorismate dehydratase
MKRLRISAISFLNTAPLMWDFEHGERQEDFDIEYTLPSRCAEALRAGAADIGIIPAISYQTIPDLVVIPEIAIAAKGPVRSILLVSKVALESINSVAVDTSSRTSAALLQILFAKYWRPNVETRQQSSEPKFIPMEANLGSMLKGCDAALLIGDPALAIDRRRYHVLDLAEEWHKVTGKPFVFAFWAVRKQALAAQPLRDELTEIFQRSRDHGLANVDLLAKEWAPRLSLDSSDIKTYLTKNISYSLDQQNLAGLRLFFDDASRLGIIPGTPRHIEFLSTAAADKVSAFSR